MRRERGARTRGVVSRGDGMSDKERAVVTRVLAGMTSAVEEAADLDQELRDVIRDHEEAQEEGAAGE